MPDPSWTLVYNFKHTPEWNRFTRNLYGSPIVQENSQNLTLDTNNGDVAFVTSDVPSLDMSLGATLEIEASTTLTGDIGAEFTFLDAAFGFRIYLNKVIVDIVSNNWPPYIWREVATADNSSPTLWRLTIDNTRQLRLYRATVLIVGPESIPVKTCPFQRVLFWGEEGGVQTFTKMAFWLGGAMAP